MTSTCTALVSQMAWMLSLNSQRNRWSVSLSGLSSLILATVLTRVRSRAAEDSSSRICRHWITFTRISFLKRNHPDYSLHLTQASLTHLYLIRSSSDHPPSSSPECMIFICLINVDCNQIFFLLLPNLMRTVLLPSPPRHILVVAFSFGFYVFSSRA